MPAVDIAAWAGERQATAEDRIANNAEPADTIRQAAGRGDGFVLAQRRVARAEERQLRGREIELIGDDASATAPGNGQVGPPCDGAIGISGGEFQTADARASIIERRRNIGDAELTFGDEVPRLAPVGVHTEH